MTAWNQTNKKCSSCDQNKAEVRKRHEEDGHNVECIMRYDFVDDDTLCEDCIDDILGDIF